MCCRGGISGRPVVGKMEWSFWGVNEIFQSSRGATFIQKYKTLKIYIVGVKKEFLKLREKKEIIFCLFK